MATTTFTNGVTLTDAGWFNDVDAITYDGTTSQILVGGGAGSIAVWTAATGTGAPVRGTSPTITTSIVSGSTTMAIFNTVATTVNAFGAASVALNMGHASGTNTILGASTFSQAGTFSSTLGVTGALTATGGIELKGAQNITNAQYVVWYDAAHSGAQNVAIRGTGGVLELYGTSAVIKTNGSNAISISSAQAVTIPGTLGVTGKITATTAGIDVPVSALGTCYSSTYTPTLTNTTNLTASTAAILQYNRIGNTVTVSGRLEIDPTIAGSVVLGISLPVASDIASSTQCGGTSAGLAQVESFAIYGDATNNRATLEGISVDTSNHSIWVNFMYQVV